MTATGAVTERPWRVDTDDASAGVYTINDASPAWVCECITEEAARHIILCVNAFDEMKAALEPFAKAAVEVDGWNPPIADDEQAPMETKITAGDLRRARTALATGATP